MVFISKQIERSRLGPNLSLYLIDFCKSLYFSSSKAQQEFDNYDNPRYAILDQKSIKALIPRTPLTEIIICAPRNQEIFVFMIEQEKIRQWQSPSIGTEDWHNIITNMAFNILPKNPQEIFKRLRICKDINQVQPSSSFSQVITNPDLSKLIISEVLSIKIKAQDLVFHDWSFDGKPLRSMLEQFRKDSKRHR
jgi:hypothetical protein